MRRFLVDLLAVIGALGLVVAVLGAVVRKITGPEHVVVTGRDHRPLPGVPVFLDRGGAAIERYTTDSAGGLEFPLESRELQRAIWLICAPGAIPMIGMRDASQAGPTTYGYTLLPDSTWGWYRAKGWRGPIPRECPRGTDSVGWRYPASSGKGEDAITFAEPVWPTESRGSR